MTRHELKEQLQHDQFSDRVYKAVGYATSHRKGVTLWVALGLAVLVAAGGIWWYVSAQREARQQDLAAAMSILDAQIGPPNEYVKTFLTEDARRDAWQKALTAVINKDGGTREGLIAQYYRGTLLAQKNDIAGAEADLRRVADSSIGVTPLAKIALAQLYVGENKITEAQALLRGLIGDPSGLVSKAQAQILLAQIDQGANPQAAKDLLKSIDAADQQRAAVKHASEQLSTQLTK